MWATGEIAGDSLRIFWHFAGALFGVLSGEFVVMTESQQPGEVSEPS